MENKQSENFFEQQYLQDILAIARQQLEQARKAAKEKKDGMAELKKEARENASHTITNLYDADDFEALAEMGQYTNAIAQIISDYDEENRKISRLEKLMQTPYFARIDFLFQDEEEAEKIYIGRSALANKSSGDIYVYDWRSPIASVFYRFMSGKAFYDAPCGKIEGTVERKRQYEIHNGVLEYFFDTDMNISDAILRRLLSQNSSPKMKAVVETIQKEQDIVIRDMETDLLMVQGVAGSGKTSIALHRAAYLMYQGLQSKLSGNNILIISPNNAFEQYISNVLPELGEENVNSAVFEDLLETVLKEKPFQPKNDFLEQLLTNDRQQEIVKRSMEFKMSNVFKDILDLFLADVPSHWIEFHDIYYDGDCIVRKKQLQEWVQQRPEVLLGLKLEQLEDYVLELAFGTLHKKKDAEEKNRIRQEIQQFATFNIIRLYSRLFWNRDYFDSLAKNAIQMIQHAPQEQAAKTDQAPVWNSRQISRIWKYTRANLNAKKICYDDAIAAAYLYLKIFGCRDYQNIRQVVIDEAQDYYPLQYEIFGMLFFNAKFTILGDMNQTLAKTENLALYECIDKILSRRRTSGQVLTQTFRKSSLITLDKSFRCTNEILNFSLQFIEHRPQIKSFNRKGELPNVIASKDAATFLDAVIQEVNTCREKGFHSICLLCKTRKNAVRLLEALAPSLDVHLITDNSIDSLHDTFIMPVYMSKGLEFDAVIVCDANSQNYSSEDDKKLLYVECTRALHRLCLICEGDVSRFIVSYRCS